MPDWILEACAFFRDINQANAAAWVQAVGSVVAIFVAVIVASSQARHSLAQEEARYKRRMNALSGLFERALESIQDVSSGFSQGHNVAKDFSIMHQLGPGADILDELKAIEITSFESADAVRAFLRLRGYFITAQDFVSELSKMTKTQTSTINWVEIGEAMVKLRVKSIAAHDEVLLAIAKTHDVG
jgi:hypothetical protein